LVDREDDTITLKVTSLGPILKNAIIKVFENKYFTITLDKKFLSKKIKGNYAYEVKLKDNKHGKFKLINFKIKIKI